MLSLFIDSKPVTLLPDTSISIEEVNPLWDISAGGAFSYEFDIPIEENRHILGNTDDLRGSSIYKLLQGKPFRLDIDGIPFRYGIIRLDKEVSINSDGTVSISLASGNKEFDDLISDLNCRDIDISSDNIKLGRALVGLSMDQHVSRMIQSLSVSEAYYVDGYGTHHTEIPISSKEFFLPGAYANNSLSYAEGAKFCNIRLCYQHYKKDNSSDTATYEATDKMDTMEYNDAGAAPNFYVRYFLKKLFNQIGIAVSYDAMSTMDDFNRLAFVNTNPCFKTSVLQSYKIATIATPFDGRGDKYFDEMGNYPAMFSCYDVEPGAPRQVARLWHSNITYGTLPWSKEAMVVTEDSNINLVRAYAPKFKIESMTGGIGSINIFGDGMPVVLKAEVYASESDVYATSENFPDEDVSSIIEALQNAFGLRFLFTNSNRSVDIRLLRDIFNDTSVVDFSPEVFSVEKTEEDIRGFELRYSASNDNPEKDPSKKTEYYNSNDNSTSFDYDDFSVTAYRNYKDIKKSICAYDRCCYLDKVTGNAYRIKVNADAENAAELKPSLFEVAQFVPAKEGDCSDKDYIETIDIGFNPVISNDTNKDNDKQEFAILVDAEIHTKSDDRADEKVNVNDNNTAIYDVLGELVHPDPHTYTPAGKSTISSTLNYSFSSHRDFDRSSNEESPIFSYDWGFSLGVMRGPGSDGRPTIIETNYDGEGNDKWVMTSGSYAFHQDIMDNYGNIFDYNGAGSGSGSGTGSDFDDLFSLRTRAEKENPRYTPDLPPTDPNYVPRFFEINGIWAPKRGLFDKFYSEYSYWVLNRKLATITCRMELADILRIDMTKRLRINGVIGFVKQLSYTLTNSSDPTARTLSDLTLQLYYL